MSNPYRTTDDIYDTLKDYLGLPMDAVKIVLTLEIGQIPVVEITQHAPHKPEYDIDRLPKVYTLVPLDESGNILPNAGPPPRESGLRSHLDAVGTTGGKATGGEVAMSEWQIVAIPTHPVDGGRWVRVRVDIHRNADGLVRQYKDDLVLLDGEFYPSTYVWREGNYACDCNRALLFDRAGNEEEMAEYPCGDGAYSVQIVNPEDGQIFYMEESE